MSRPTLFLSGFSRDDEAALRTLIDQAQAQLQPHWSLASETDAGALAIDMDSIYGQMALMKALGSGKTLIAVTEGARADTPYLLRRPFDVDALVRVLNAAAAETLLSGTAAPAPATPESTPMAAPVAAPAPVSPPSPAAPPPPAVAVVAPAPAAVEPAPSAAPALDLQAKYKLERWPQIDRSYPKHFRIATLMLKGPGSVAEIAEATGASPEEVIEFVLARLASGHAVKA